MLYRHACCGRHSKQPSPIRRAPSPAAPRNSRHFCHRCPVPYPLETPLRTVTTPGCNLLTCGMEGQCGMGRAMPIRYLPRTHQSAHQVPSTQAAGVLNRSHSRPDRPWTKTFLRGLPNPREATVEREELHTGNAPKDMGNFTFQSDTYHVVGP
jgi:hypothetical protein